MIATVCLIIITGILSVSFAVGLALVGLAVKGKLG